MNKFYVYEWIRLDTNEPFYVGKGHGERAYHPFRNKYFNRVVNKVGIDNVVVVILHENLTEELSFEYEVYYISLYRKLGFSLTNMTDGGEGSAGLIHTEESRKRISKNHARLSGERHSKSMLGRSHSEEAKRKMSKAMLGRKLSKDHKRRISEWAKKRTGSKNPMAKAITIFKNGEFYDEYISITEASLSLGGISGSYPVAQAIRKLSKGWTPRKGHWVGWSATIKSECEKDQAII